jgi:hypothetical protein
LQGVPPLRHWTVEQLMARVNKIEGIDLGWRNYLRERYDVWWRKEGALVLGTLVSRRLSDALRRFISTAYTPKLISYYVHFHSLHNRFYFWGAVD